MSAGRFAPSPSGDLHVGNLRTAMLAWLFARSTNRKFLLRIEDLDRVQPGAEARQIEDLLALGLTFDQEVIRQSERIELYEHAIVELQDRGLTFECFCTRREILEAPSAPHRPPGAYPGTCRNLSETQRAERRAHRAPAIRLRADVDSWTVSDALAGEVTAEVDDFVLRRADGVPAYNLAVVVDDAEMGIDQVVRADDLLTSAPRQAYLGHLLGFAAPDYVHVPLAVNTQGQRLAKRDGAVTYRELTALGVDVFSLITGSLSLHGSTPAELLEEFTERLSAHELQLTTWVF